MNEHLPDLRGHPQAIRLVKKPIPVSVSFAATEGTLQTLEGPVPFRKGDALLTGVQGERWPVPRETFERRYEPAAGTAAGADGRYIKKPLPVWALQITAEMAPLSVAADGGGILTGRAGDWLLQYDDGSYGVITDAILRETYDRAPDAGGSTTAGQVGLRPPAPRRRM